MVCACDVFFSEAKERAREVQARNFQAWPARSIPRAEPEGQGPDDVSGWRSDDGEFDSTREMQFRPVISRGQSQSFTELGARLEMINYITIMLKYVRIMYISFMINHSLVSDDIQ